MTYRRTLLPAAAAAGALALAGVTAAAAQTPALPRLTVNLTKSTISVAGSGTAGAVDVAQTSTVSSSVGFFRLNNGASTSQLLAALPHAQNPDSLMKYGRILYDATAPKGGSMRATRLPAGRYVAVNEAAQNPSQWSHTTFSVGAASGTPATLPHAAATIRAIDFAFRSPRTLHRGSVVRFRDKGYVTHEIAAIRVKNRKAARKLKRALKAGKDNKAQKLAIGFAELAPPIMHGAVEQQRLDIHKGRYVLACFMDTQDGREHTRLGMYRSVVVK